jgi:5-formyltetrahydrofolate cyclo-ligase
MQINLDKNQKPQDLENQSQKKVLRKKLLTNRLAMSKSEVTSKTSKIIKLLESLPEIKEAKIVHSYLPTKNEVDTFPFLINCFFQNKRVFVPLVPETGFDLMHHEIYPNTTFEPGKFDLPCACEITEFLIPEDFMTEKDIILVPLLGFDEDLNRLGYGKGYYDRFLENIDSLKIGLAFESQKTPKIQKEETDVPLDFVITEEKIYTLSQ